MEAGGSSSIQATNRAEKLQQMREKYGQVEEEDCFPPHPKRGSFYANHCMEDVDTHKIGHTDWCSCGHCITMPTGIESVCCTEIGNLQPHLEGIQCITQHRYFPYMCENSDIVHIHMNMLAAPGSAPPEDKNRSLRKTAYRGFSAWIHGQLGSGARRPVPACTVNKVRAAFPDPDLCNDYAAEYMAFD